MSTTLSRPRRSTTRPGLGCRTRGGRARELSASPELSREIRKHGGERVGSYVDDHGRPREIVRWDSATGSRLVIDRDRLTSADRRLVAHLAPDEPAANVRLICEMYLRESPLRRCRRLTAEDLHTPPITELEGQVDTSSGLEDDKRLRDSAGNGYRLSRVRSRIAIPELRWCKQGERGGTPARPLSVREVVGAIESYEPIRTLTAAAICRYQADDSLSVSTLSVELERLNRSRVVLNKRLREVVLAAVDSSELSMSEIALRCGRVKRDRRGALSGETTWLARRVGLVCEGGSSTPSPWVHSDVLALIARRGLGVAPREVELT